MKIRRAGAELFYEDGVTDGQTNNTKLVVAFRNVVRAPEKSAALSSNWHLNPSVLTESIIHCFELCNAFQKVQKANSNI